MKGRKSGDRENEIKLAVASAAAARRLLRSAGFHVSKPRVLELNLVFDTPDHSILHGSALLRVRQIGKRGVLTYKGPSDSDGLHRSREEVESEVDDPRSTRHILERLGYQVVFRYDKFRTEFERPHESGTATVDETPLGVYMELEGPPRWVDRMAQALGFSPADYIKSSYGRLWAEHCAARGEPMRDMLFPARRS
jgi:adenylate cyclase, class 2